MPPLKRFDTDELCLFEADLMTAMLIDKTTIKHLLPLESNLFFFKKKNMTALLLGCKPRVRLVDVATFEK